MERLTEVTKDCFNAVLQLQQADPAALPAPEEVHHRFRGAVDDLLVRASSAGFSHADAQDIAYALVALVDEVVLTRGSEALRDFWGGQLLQLHYFQENVAGEAFFTRLAALQRDPRRAEVLRAYHLALLFGFQGRYRVRGGELELASLTESVGRALQRGREEDEVLSPHGERPGEGAGRVARGGLVLWIGGGALALSLLLYLGLRITLATGTASALDRITQTATP